MGERNNHRLESSLYRRGCADAKLCPYCLRPATSGQPADLSLCPRTLLGSYICENRVDTRSPFLLSPTPDPYRCVCHASARSAQHLHLVGTAVPFNFSR